MSCTPARSQAGPRHRSRRWAYAAALVLSPLVAGAQPAPKSEAKADAKPASAELFPGWALAVVGPGVKMDKDTPRQWAASAAFSLLPGESLVPTVPASGFSAAFSTEITIETPGTYTFGVESEGGAASISVSDSAAKELGSVSRPAVAPAGAGFTKALALKAGKVMVTARFTRNADRAARLRVLWSRERAGVDDPGFFTEPMPIGACSVPTFARPQAKASREALHGRSKIGELGCISCHAPNEQARGAITPVAAPILNNPGEHFDPRWMRTWILKPQEMKPGSAMPALFGESEQEIEEADAIVHYLVSMGGPVKFEPVANERTIMDDGRYSYHVMGCVMCHGALDAPDKALYDDSLPKTTPKLPTINSLAHVGKKWRAAALSEFLKNPRDLHPGGRMPSMELSTEQADVITAYVMRKTGLSDKAIDFKIDPAKVEAGRAAFASRGCASCHQVTTGGSLATRAAKPLADLTPGTGCMDPGDAKTPRYTLADADRAAINAGLVEVKKIINAKAPIDAAHRAFKVLNCTSCHMRDGEGGPNAEQRLFFRITTEAELGDEGRLAPNLTNVGFKLTSPWLRKVLMNAGRARPYMGTRMPQYAPELVRDLPQHLASCDGVWAERDREEPKPTDEIAQAGRRLMGEKGLNCISCHVFGRFPPAGTPGPNITDFAERIRYDWWNVYVRDPVRWKPGTRMPQFYITGKGQVTDVFGGDPQQQIDALWAYMSLSSFAPPPDGLQVKGGDMLKVTDRPVVFRVFLADAGSRGIAVGYPQQTHFAFDATAVRLVSAWKGEFLDTSAAWKNRGGMIAGGRGNTEWKAPNGPAFALGTPTSWPTATGTEAGHHFKGYTLDTSGTPTFEYEIKSGTSSLTVFERFVPATKPGALLRREFVLKGSFDTATFNPGPGKCDDELAKGELKWLDPKNNERWLQITPANGEASFSIEVTP